MPLIDEVSAEISRIVQIGFLDVRERLAQDTNEILLRKFRANYAKMNLEEILAVQQVSGHEDAEKTPCKACNIMAQQELKLASEEERVED